MCGCTLVQPAVRVLPGAGSVLTLGLPSTEIGRAILCTGTHIPRCKSPGLFETRQCWCWLQLSQSLG